MLTWITSLAIMVLCAASFLKLFFIPQTVPSSSETCMICGSKFEEYLVPALFLSMANTYGMLGIFNYRASQQTTTTNDEDTELMQLIMSIVPLVTSFLAVLLGLAMMGATPTSKIVTRRALFWISLLSFFGLALISVVENVNVFSSEVDLHTLVSIGGLLVLWAFYIRKAIREKDRRFHSLIKALSVMAFVISCAYENIFYPKCDSFEAYQNCFRDCPLSANHQNTSALINVAVLMATIGWTISENSVPSIQAPKELIDPTVASCDDSASIDTIEDFQGVTPDSMDSERLGPDLESGSHHDDTDDDYIITEEEYSPFDRDETDTAETEVPPIDDSPSEESSMIDEKE
ncbi:unnamed protein product [Cylindrotheca closterium]|uniref:Transmembrane protein n=1 Tax=Cylindrotheca closterium TaxID=2856 RepID=A0AAD2CIY0_9STRA|nr:unnamed protein product [Cylindrotheca closterium]